MSIVLGKPAELPEDQPSLYRGDDRLEHRRSEESCLFSAFEGSLMRKVSGARLARDGQEDQIGSADVVGVGTDDHRRSFFAGGLIGEGERHEHDVTEPKGGRSRHPQGCPRLCGMPARIASSRRESSTSATLSGESSRIFSRIFSTERFDFGIGHLLASGLPFSSPSRCWSESTPARQPTPDDGASFSPASAAAPRRSPRSPTRG